MGTISAVLYTRVPLQVPPPKKKKIRHRYQTVPLSGLPSGLSLNPKLVQPGLLIPTPSTLNPKT